MLKYSFLFILFGLCLNDLTVTWPQELREKFNSNDEEGSILYVLSVFGTLSFTKHQDVVVYSTSTNKNRGCEPITDQYFSEDPVPYVYILERGDCLFKDKVLNAQNVGAYAVIVYNEYDNEQVEGVVPYIIDGKLTR